MGTIERGTQIMKEKVMYISFPSSKPLTFASPVRHSVLILVFALLAVVGCEQDQTTELKARIAKR